MVIGPAETLKTRSNMLMKYRQAAGKRGPVPVTGPRVPVTPSPIPMNAVVQVSSTGNLGRFRLEVKGAIIRVLENNTLIFEVNDYSFSRGRLLWRIYGEPLEPAKASFRLIQLLPY